MFKMAFKSPKGRLGRYEKTPSQQQQQKIKSHKHPQVSDNTEKNWEREREKKPHAVLAILSALHEGMHLMWLEFN